MGVVDWLVLVVLEADWLFFVALACDWLFLVALEADWLFLVALACDWLLCVGVGRGEGRSDSKSELNFSPNLMNLEIYK